MRHDTGALFPRADAAAQQPPPPKDSDASRLPTGIKRQEGEHVCSLRLTSAAYAPPRCACAKFSRKETAIQAMQPPTSAKERAQVYAKEARAACLFLQIAASPFALQTACTQARLERTARAEADISSMSASWKVRHACRSEDILRSHRAVGACGREKGRARRQKAPPRRRGVLPPRQAARGHVRGVTAAAAPERAGNAVLRARRHAQRRQMKTGRKAAARRAAARRRLRPAKRSRQQAHVQKIPAEVCASAPPPRRVATNPARNAQRRSQTRHVVCSYGMHQEDARQGATERRGRRMARRRRV